MKHRPACRALPKVVRPITLCAPVTNLAFRPLKLKQCGILLRTEAQNYETLLLVNTIHFFFFNSNTNNAKTFSKQVAKTDSSKLFYLKKIE